MAEYETDDEEKKLSMGQLATIVRNEWSSMSNVSIILTTNQHTFFKISINFSS